jgi:hypothetical protein
MNTEWRLIRVSGLSIVVEASGKRSATQKYEYMEPDTVQMFIVLRLVCRAERDGITHTISAKRVSGGGCGLFLNLVVC